MSSERLERLNDAMQGLVDDGLLAGITTMISRQGRSPTSAPSGTRTSKPAPR